MRPLIFISLILWLVSCQNRPDYYPPFEKGDFQSIAKPFGPSRTYIPGIKPQFYDGLLLGLANNTTIYAMADGIVTSACISCEKTVLGNHIIIADKYGLEITYYHLSEISVGEGTTLPKGKKIATSGNSGMTTMKHGLGIRVKLKGELVDPRHWVDGIVSN